MATGDGAYLALGVVALVSAVFPLVNAELAVVGAVAALPDHNLFLLIAVATAAQMVGKSAMYWLGRKGSRLTDGRYARALERWGDRFAGSRNKVGALVFVSSISGLPPFYAISTLAGVFRTSFVAFLVAGTAGRFLHFGAIGLFPSAVRAIAG
ncbi:MAG TPA: VTT domain-containing protein [Vicinamibacterales bacterium]|nr:VTT domain-containing protein [Vicinamibacterales bacterium]